MMVFKGFKMQYQPFTLWGNVQATPEMARGNRAGLTTDYSSSSFLTLEADEDSEARIALRWRSTVLRLSDHFTAASASHPELAPVMMEALGNALEQLLLFGRTRDLDLIEDWLDEELRMM
jgi:hypothetical protein